MTFSFQKPINLTLSRYPQSRDKSLQAWNAADEYLIEELSQTPQVNAPVLIVNDQFGALACSFKELSPTIWTDSQLSKLAITQNLTQNFAAVESPKFFKSDFVDRYQLKTAKLQQMPRFKTVVIRIPKHLSLLRFQLQVISQLIDQDSLIIAGGMTKEIHNSTIALFESIIGPSKTSLAKKKSRLVFAQFQGTQHLPNVSKTAENIDIKQYQITPPLSKNQTLNLVGLPGVFAREKLDLGAQVLIPFLPDLSAEDIAIDLGCGNGVLGSVLAQSQSSASVYLTDESELAILSAQTTFKLNQLENGTFLQSDCLDEFPPIKANLIVCNPPFHQQNTQTLDIARKMFKQSARFLDPSGTFLVVSNRHLKYLPYLKSHFNEVKVISKDPKFNVWQARQPKY